MSAAARMGYESDPPLPAELRALVVEALAAERRDYFASAGHTPLIGFDLVKAAEAVARVTLKWNRAQIDGGA